MLPLIAPGRCKGSHLFVTASLPLIVPPTAALVSTTVYSSVTSTASPSISSPRPSPACGAEGLQNQKPPEYKRELTIKRASLANTRVIQSQTHQFHIAEMAASALVGRDIVLTTSAIDLAWIQMGLEMLWSRQSTSCLSSASGPIVA